MFTWKLVLPFAGRDLTLCSGNFCIHPNYTYVLHRTCPSPPIRERSWRWWGRAAAARAPVSPCWSIFTSRRPARSSWTGCRYVTMTTSFSTKRHVFLQLLVVRVKWLTCESGRSLLMSWDGFCFSKNDIIPENDVHHSMKMAYSTFTHHFKYLKSNSSSHVALASITTKFRHNKLQSFDDTENRKPEFRDPRVYSMSYLTYEIRWIPFNIWHYFWNMYESVI